MLKIFEICTALAFKKIQRYQWYHVLGTHSNALTNQVLHIDDPMYSLDELKNIINWNERLKNSGLVGILVVTNEYSRDFYRNVIKDLPIYIVEQGFTEVKSVNMRKNKRFSCVYSSPFIDYGKDRHSNHSAWGSTVLIDQILPKLAALEPEVEVHLIGQLGKEARKEVSRFPNVICHGYVDRFKNAEIIQSCHVSIYPRVFDHYRAVQKIAEYIGAGNPIVAFRLVDTVLVDKLQLGITVLSTQEFVEAIISLKQIEKYLFFRGNVEIVQKSFTWRELAGKLESIIAHHDTSQ
jgi:glycosyltransferase involved in cell wall biosynthesis